MWEEEEPPMLEYARFYELTTDHREPHPLLAFTQNSAVLVETEDSGLFEIDTGIATPARERLSFGKDAVAFLLSIQAEKGSPTGFSDVAVPQTHRVRNLKIESPLLRSDHELDVRHFGGRIIPNLANEHLPYEKVDDERDEGLCWPNSYNDIHTKATLMSAAEKFEVSRDIVLYIRDTLQHQAKSGELLRFNNEIKAYGRSELLEPMTPPLLPMSPEAAPFVPSSDIGCLDLLSEHPSPIREELKELDRLILGKDALVPQLSPKNTQHSDHLPFSFDNIADLYSPLKDINDLPPPISYRRLKAEDFKVDGPLTPPRSELQPPQKQKNASFLESMVHVIPELPSPIPRPEDTSSDDIERFFAEVVRPIAEQVDRRMEQEQLQEADTMTRVKVPIIDFSRPSPPWNNPVQRSKELLLDIKNEHLKSCSWPLSGKAERALPWAPFPKALAKAAEHEVIEGDENIVNWTIQPESVDPSTLVWKSDGLRILDIDELDTEDIGIGHFSEMADIRSLIRKRKLDLQEVSADQNTPLKSTLRDDGSSKSNLLVSDSLLGSFSTFDALDTFTCVRTGEPKRPKIEKTSYFPSTIPTTRDDPVPAETLAVTVTSREEEPFALPKLIVPSTARQFIVSSQFLSNRHLFYLIQTLYPTAEFISRDLILYHRIPPPYPTNSLPTLPETSIAHEADILLSPSTGLLYTTLQKLAQRPLPGSKGLSPIFNRILLAAPRYEQLIILVGDASPCATTMDATASHAPLMELHAFCAALPLSSNPSVLFVPNNGNAGSAGDNLTPLATYIVHLMINYSSNTPSSCLQECETNHEIFLRRAGLNPFAAQAVLADLKPPVLSREWAQLGGSGELRSKMDGNRGLRIRDEDGEERILWGLAAFVRMSGEERLRRWGGNVGRGLLERVGRVIDARW
ncbi:hypothetical protein MMC13_001048 [Lambiella insularis]|nr:hypothetical protein [Lambiella insularis]